MSSIMLTHPLVLASGSEIRRTMLQEAGIGCMVIKPAVDEEALREKSAKLPIPDQALMLARAKAAQVADGQGEALVLAADQICELDGNILSKPGNHANAVKQLKAMQGKVHRQHSAACLFLDEKEIWSAVETAALTMRPLTTAEIEAYLHRDTPYQSCGSYKYESFGKHLFAKVQGNDDIIMGMPLQALLCFLHDRGFASLLELQEKA
jgi:septum formation protein